MGMEKFQTGLLRVSGVDLEFVEGGSGRPILFLHPWIGLAPGLPFLDALGRRGRVLAPSHPGFGRSSLPRHFSSVDDLAYFYLDLLDHFNLRECVLVGVSFGAWIAAEIAIKCCDRIGALVLANPVGIKIGQADEVHIVDYFSVDSEQFAKLAYANPEHNWIDPATLSDEQLEIAARNRDAAALFGWQPFMYDPKLSQRLHRIKAPTLVIKGQQDRIVSANYAADFSKLLPTGQLEILPDAGHFPHIEQPQAFADRIGSFILQALK
jgi:pimeloyl-ACP methyl ester carboxylesterase